ncbi:cytosolic endo-beta-N-acetylglucosaminidase isoform X2 [Rhipicephalus microplus]|uniref:cytosolic endo-beta-N-acetylglucosaminidase isoform X2 n=1 Tax=Rhipicephalus microplus TaxID=6941 RepID=UPI003F6C60BC
MDVQPQPNLCTVIKQNKCSQRFIHGSEESNLYRFHHWQIIDTFIYYSHYMVTIPPPGWISAAHRHGVKVLGTFILGDGGIKTINIVRGSGLTAQVATQLAKVATVGRFDGWLVSIGCKMDRSCIPFVKNLLRAITSEMHKAVPGSLVIWYDAVDVDGNAKPHNQLNQKNVSFFDQCDGIFLNFQWTEAMLLSSAQFAGNRKADVYVGVDVFGRDTTYPGGFETYKAVQRVRGCGLSAAVFAAAWVYQTQGKRNFAKHNYRLWSFPDSCCADWRLTKPPLSTSFCQGFGSKVFAEGQRMFGRVWFNLHKQQLQPRDQGNALCNSCCSVKLHLEEAYNGGGCLRVLFKPNRNDPDIKPYIRFIYGTEEAQGYRFHHWQVIDTFIYYSHHMVTIPPPGWITAAHKHAVKVLGTFILGKDGTKALNTIRFSGLTSQVAVQLANVARVGRFDGWLISIGCKMDPSCISFLEDLLSFITEETHKAVPGSLVIWYDAVDVDGNAKPHNELNEKNACFFDLCDGIFLDFRWNEDMLLNSARVAGDRKADVYAGVDVYARETWYPGGYDMYKAVQLARRCGLSAAIFAAGWVYETQDEKNFAANQRRLWALSEDCRSQCKITALPLSTTFCQGCGPRLYNQGRVVKPAPWFDLSKQQLQPRDQGTNLCGGGGSAILSTATSYTGGGCLYLHYSPEKAPGSTLIPYFKLFGFDLPLGSLCVSYAFKNKQQGSLAGHDVNLILRVRDVGGKEDELSLSSVIVVPQSEKYIVEREITDSAQGDLSLAQGGWLTRKYHVKDATGSALLEEIGISFNANEEIACYLGELVVKRPEVTSEREAAGDPKDCGQHDQAEEGLESITFEYSMSSDESD